MKKIFEVDLIAGWGDMDFNGHMANTAYLDKSGDVRLMFFAANYFSGKQMARLRIGPVIMKDNLEYYKEIGLMESITCSLYIAGLSKDGSRFKLRNEFRNEKGELAAQVTSVGGWLDLNTRKLIIPPEKIQLMMNNLVKSDDYEELHSSIK